ncbi:MAG: hypothetical protein J0I06_23600 [Planctomycetes bacterium]|nr:hypothetical protein [Planctomycetota bacterium]
MEFPTWLSELSKQFPVVVLCALVVWRAARFLDAKHKEATQILGERHAAEVKAINELTAARVEDLKTQHAAHIASLNKEVERLIASAEAATKDRDRLLRRLLDEGKGADS